MKNKPTQNKKEAGEIKTNGKAQFENGKLVIPSKKKPTPKKEKKEEIIVLKFEDLISSASDLKLTKRDFTDCHGGFRFLDDKIPIADVRPAKYGMRFYPGRDGMVKAIQVKTPEDLERATKIMKAIQEGRVIKDKKIVGYKHGKIETESKKEFIEQLIREI